MHEAHRPRHRPRHERQHLPLRHLCPHPRRHPRRGPRAGGLSHGRGTRCHSPAAPRCRAGAGLVIGVHLPGAARRARAVRRRAGLPPRRRGRSGAFAPNAFVRVGADDTVTVLIKHIEFGQGPFTGLATLVAEELDADWSQMRAEHAPSDPDLYKNLAFGDAGHRRLHRDRQLLRADAQGRRRRARHAGARGGRGLERAGRARSRSSAACCATRSSGREGRFGEFAAAAAQLPVPDDAPLKDPAAFRLIGREGEGASEARQRGQVQRHGAVHHRHPRAGHADRGGRAPAALRRQGRALRRGGGAARAGRGRRQADPLRRRGLRRRHLAGAQGAREALRVTWDESGGREARQRASSSRSTARWRASPAWWRASTATPRRRWRAPGDGAADRGGVRLPLSRARADGAARRLPALGRQRAPGALRQPAPDGGPPDHRRRARPQARAGEGRDHAGRRQLRPARAAHDASRRRAGRGRQGDRPGAAGQAGLDARGRHPRRLLPAAVRAPHARRRARREDRRLGQHRRRPVLPRRARRSRP